MAKTDSPALLAPGMHLLTLQDLEAVAVTPFPGAPRRAELFQGLLLWVGALRAHGLTGTLWIDGSFLTEKECPGDIDCVLWNAAWVDPSAATPEAQHQVAKLLDKASAEALYNLDFYMEHPTPAQVFHREAYWRGILGFCHDRITAKGFAEITL